MTKFPKDRSSILICVAGYFAFSFILAVLDWLVIGQSAMCIKIGDQSVLIDVRLPSFSPELLITLRCRETTRLEVLNTSAAKYLDTDGLLDQEALFNDFNGLVTKFKAKENKNTNYCIVLLKLSGPKN